MTAELPLDLPALAKLSSPFTEDQLASLDEYQQSATDHPYTCPRDHPWCDEDEFEHPLRCWTDPLECICTGCDYTQDWVWAYTADWSWQHKRQEAS